LGCYLVIRSQSMNPDILKFPAVKIDTHLHTRHSCDSDMDPHEACRRALDLGLGALIFTEHMDFDPSDEGFGFYDAVAIRQSLDSCRRQFPGLAIFRGVEVTYQAKFQKQIARFLRNGKFDYALGSVHMIGEGDISRQERQAEYFEGRSEAEAYGAYFDEAARAAASGLFDALGHLDLCKKYGVLHYGRFEWKNYQDRIEKILRILAARDMVLELNTSGLRQNPGETYPSIEVIQYFRTLGGRKVFLASDAHRVDQLALGFEKFHNIF